MPRCASGIPSLPVPSLSCRLPRAPDLLAAVDVEAARPNETAVPSVRECPNVWATEGAPAPGLRVARSSCPASKTTRPAASTHDPEGWPVESHLTGHRPGIFRPLEFVRVFATPEVDVLS